ncbi:hypothetical protein CICLE_v10017501mg [Citrus x clementina]|uniref:Uncharacterized protein n=1 Tax=Citrus clementina TaxID=85681 RepID=V4UAN7_CITCL|nr:hypothetical protein CICLE_v10017501mg [Citrus x clementina]
MSEAMQKDDLYIRRLPFTTFIVQLTCKKAEPNGEDEDGKKIPREAGYQPQSSMAMYGVTKTALLGLTKALAAEMAPDTRVNCVAPGFVPTHFAEYITSNDGVAF